MTAAGQIRVLISAIKDTNRRGFLKGVATLSALGAVKCGSAMLPDEQAAYDMYNAMVVPRPVGLLDGEPVLQVPAPDSMGLAFAVTALANGFAEVADNPEMKNPVCLMDIIRDQTGSG